MTQIADKVYRNAKVYSIAFDGTETHAEAVAIKDGKFVSLTAGCHHIIIICVCSCYLFIIQNKIVLIWKRNF